MRYHIRHRTSYTFGSAVFLEPHILRYRPRSDDSQRVESFSLTVDPEPSGLSAGLDLSGNEFTVAWFTGTTTHFTIEVESVVSTLRHNPFDYIILPEGAEPLPWSLQDSAAVPFLQRASLPAHDHVAEFAAGLVARDNTIAPFLAALNDELHRSTKVIVRDEGDPFEPAETLETKVGSCRDLAVLFVDACRSAGVPARFVSGYQEGDPEQDERYLHAWAEAFIPGAGWRGYDPTLGLIVADRHIPVAAAADSRDAAPTTGNFRGSPPSVTLDFELEVRELGTNPAD